MTTENTTVEKSAIGLKDYLPSLNQGEEKLLEVANALKEVSTHYPDSLRALLLLTNESIPETTSKDVAIDDLRSLQGYVSQKRGTLVRFVNIASQGAGFAKSDLAKDLNYKVPSDSEKRAKNLCLMAIAGITPPEAPPPEWYADSIKAAMIALKEKEIDPENSVNDLRRLLSNTFKPLQDSIEHFSYIGNSVDKNWKHLRADGNARYLGDDEVETVDVEEVKE